MFLLRAAMPVLLASLTVSAAVINLSGTVTGSSGKPIKGAIVTITGQKISDTTDEKGGYAIQSGNVAVRQIVANASTEQVAFDNGIISMKLPSSAPVSIELFNLRGTLLKKAVSPTISDGEYRYNVKADPFAVHMLAVRVSIGNQHATFRYLPLRNVRQTVSFTAHDALSHTNGGLAKVEAAVDSLAVSAASYMSKTVALTSYETSVDVSLDTLALDKFSFFVTSQKALTLLSKSENGFGGNFSFGFTGPGAGLKGADSICSCIAEMSMEGSSAKRWRAFLSVKADENGRQVNARDRIGNGPWYDRIGHLLAPNLEDLIHTRPLNGNSTIANDLPNEEGIPNHTPDPNLGKVDNHHMVTGSDSLGKLYTKGSTCDDWTSTSATGSPRCGFAWPRSMGGGGGGMGGMNSSHWISGFDASGCKAGVHTIDDGGGGAGNGIIGSGGGYGGFYCFALTP